MDILPQVDIIVEICSNLFKSPYVYQYKKGSSQSKVQQNILDLFEDVDYSNLFFKVFITYAKSKLSSLDFSSREIENCLLLHSSLIIKSYLTYKIDYQLQNYEYVNFINQFCIQALRQENLESIIKSVTDFDKEPGFQQLIDSQLISENLDLFLDSKEQLVLKKLFLELYIALYKEKEIQKSNDNYWNNLFINYVRVQNENKLKQSEFFKGLIIKMENYTNSQGNDIKIDNPQILVLENFYPDIQHHFFFCIKEIEQEQGSQLQSVFQQKITEMLNDIITKHSINVILVQKVVQQEIKQTFLDENIYIFDCIGLAKITEIIDMLQIEIANDFFSLNTENISTYKVLKDKIRQIQLINDINSTEQYLKIQINNDNSQQQQCKNHIQGYNQNKESQLDSIRSMSNSSSFEDENDSDISLDNEHQLQEGNNKDIDKMLKIKQKNDQFLQDISSENKEDQANGMKKRNGTQYLNENNKLSVPKYTIVIYTENIRVYQEIVNSSEKLMYIIKNNQYSSLKIVKDTINLDFTIFYPIIKYWTQNYNEKINKKYFKFYRIFLKSFLSYVEKKRGISFVNEEKFPELQDLYGLVQHLNGSLEQILQIEKIIMVLINNHNLFSIQNFKNNECFVYLEDEIQQLLCTLQLSQDILQLHFVNQNEQSYY